MTLGQSDSRISVSDLIRVRGEIDNAVGAATDATVEIEKEADALEGGGGPPAVQVKEDATALALELQRLSAQAGDYFSPHQQTRRDFLLARLEGVDARAQRWPLIGTPEESHTEEHLEPVVLLIDQMDRVIVATEGANIDVREPEDNFLIPALGIAFVALAAWALS